MKSLTRRERRLLKELILNDNVSVMDLRRRIGALNPGQIAFQLRSKGWQIKTGFFAVLDRDGNICKPGYYSLEPQEKERARILLEETDRAAGTARTESSLEQGNAKIDKGHDNTGGGK